MEWMYGLKIAGMNLPLSDSKTSEYVRRKTRTCSGSDHVFCIICSLASPSLFPAEKIAMIMRPKNIPKKSPDKKIIIFNPFLIVR